MDDLIQTHHLIRSTIDKRVENKWKDARFSLKAVATLPTGDKINGAIDIWQEKYSASISLFSDNIDTQYLHEQFDANLYRQKAKWRAYRVNEKQSHIIQTLTEGDIITSFTHTMETERRSGITVLGVQCGDEGTEGRTIKQPMEFQQSMEDLCYLANTLFLPFMEDIEGYPENITYHLNFIPKDEPQSN